jgi:hypothetical protein
LPLTSPPTLPLTRRPDNTLDITSDIASDLAFNITAGQHRHRLLDIVFNISDIAFDIASNTAVQDTVYPYTASQQCCLSSTWLSIHLSDYPNPYSI